MTDSHLQSLCQLLGTKERMHAFVTSLDQIIQQQSQTASFQLPDDLFTRDEFALLREVVKTYTDLKALRKQVFEVPLLMMQISFIPTKNFLKKLVASLQSDLNEPFLLDLVVNPGIIGGCVIEFKGMYSDHSLKRDITKWRKANTIKHGR